MRLTNFSNYALRVLMYAAAKHPAPATVPEIAQAHGISYNHLKKAAASLCGAGYLDAVRGRRGGLRLARPAETIVVGDVIRLTEGGLVRRVHDPVDHRRVFLELTDLADTLLTELSSAHLDELSRIEPMLKDVLERRAARPA